MIRPIELGATAEVNGPVTVLSFTSPDRPINLNHRLHWSRRAATTRAWRHAAFVAACQLGPPSARPREASWVQLEIPVHDRRRRDPHNLTPTLKACVDGLVDAGVWPDDTPEFVTTTEPFIAVCPRGTGVVRLAITPITDRPVWGKGNTP